MSGLRFGDVAAFRVLPTGNSDDYGPAPREHPMAYPGPRPKFPFVLHDGRVYGLVESAGDPDDDPRETLARMLKRLGAAQIHSDERWPVLGYGSNANPAQLEHKFRGVPGPIVTLFTELPDHDVVYASRITGYGAIPAALCPSEGTNVEICLNVLDRRQLARMDKTEGTGSGAYERKPFLPHVKVYGNRVATYYQADSILAGSDGRPVRMAAAPARNARYPAMTEPEVLDYAASRLGDLMGRTDLDGRMLSEEAANDYVFRERANELLADMTADVNA